jgi:ADP-ribose pyrophosphatase YjhB (NUDIX family)
METQDYIKYIRNKVGNSPIIMNGGCACIVDDQGRILLQQRDEAGKEWGFPGGFLNFGETYKQAAIREVKEETGLDISIDKTLGIYDEEMTTYPNGDISQVIVVFFLAHVIGGKLFKDNVETFDLKWFAPSQAPKLFNPWVQQMLEDYMRSNCNFTDHVN